jgi:hypothetical protein
MGLGNTYIDTNNGADAFYVTRYGNVENESASFVIDDGALTINSIQDEQYGTFRINSTHDGVGTATRFNIDNDGDISFYEDQGVTPKFFWDSSAESLGIGTTSPSAPLHIVASAVAEMRYGAIGPSSNSALRISRNDSTTTSGNPLGYLEFGGNDATGAVDTSFAYVGAEASGTHAAGDNPTDLVFGTTADGSATVTERARLTSDGSLLVGGISKTSIPSLDNGVYLQSQTNGDVLGYSLYSNEGTNNRRAAFFLDDTNGVYGFDSSAASGVPDFVIRRASSEHMRIDAGGNAIFTKSGGAYLQLKDASAVRGAINVTTSDGLIFTTGASFTERMRIDSSGILLVGKTADNNAVAGVALSGSGIVKAARADWSLLLNRLTTDGALALFQKDGTTVGSIGVANGNNLTVGGSVAAHIGLQFGTGIIYPTDDTGAANDNAVALGDTNNRFTNLYLSGGVVFGTTGGSVSSKTLDDYETGTWTPVYTADSGAATHNVQTGSYVKVGKLVTVIGELQASRNTLSGAVTITGLPFASSGNGGGFNPTFTIRFASDMPNLKGYTSASSIVLKKQATSSTNSVDVIETDLSNTATNYNYLYFTATYMTA